MKQEDDLIKWDCGSPLYDSFELASLSHLIERHTLVLPYPNTTSSQFSSSPRPSSSSSSDSRCSRWSAAKGAGGDSNGGGRKSWWKLCPNKRKLEECDSVAPTAKKFKAIGCFSLGFLN